MSSPNIDFNVVKKPHAKVDYTEDQLIELMNCINDPMYYMTHFMRIRHPMLGALPFTPYPCQRRLISAFHTHRFNIVLAGRQIGKSEVFDTIITYDDETKQIGSLLALNLRERLITYLERWLLRLSVSSNFFLVANMIKWCLRSILKGLLWVIDVDHRRSTKITVDDIHKFTHVQNHSFRSDFGMVTQVFRTVPYTVWQLRTQTKTLLAADRHRVIRADHTIAWLEDLLPGDLIKTDRGVEAVISCRDLGIKNHMFSVRACTNDANSDHNHLYYTDGILSHNTESAQGYLLWRAMFVPDSTILITANTYNQALEIMDRIRYSYENTPDHIRDGVREYNKGNISFANGSRIIARATTPNSGRGLSISLLFVDEFAAISPHFAASFWSAIRPTLSTGGSCIITSTPQNDEDQFATLWRDAKDNLDNYGNLLPEGVGRNGFYASFLPWFEHPDRDEAWAETERASIGDAKFAQEHLCAFVTSQDTLINPMVLSRMRHIEPIFYTGTIRWYAEPAPNHAFLVGLDPSLGTDEDYSAIQVFQLPEMLQVAEWQHNRTDTRRQVTILLEVLYALEGILMDNPQQIGQPEIYWTFENNAIGEAILQIIEATGEERFPGSLVTERRRRGVQNAKRVRKGLNTNARNRLSALSRLKTLIETERMTINSHSMVKELKNFVTTGATFRAKPGEHDDLIMAAILIVRMLDIVLDWGSDAGSLRDYISDEEFVGEEIEPLPTII